MNKLYLPDSTELEALRALCRYETHGGYEWYGVMTDGALMCVPCLRDNYRQVFRATRDHERSDWGLQGYTNSGEMESADYCAHCHRQIGSDES